MGLCRPYYSMDCPVYSGDISESFHTSHLITTNMTHLGDNEHGPATSIAAKIQVIAHCVVRENPIVEEWLVFDQLAVGTQIERTRLQQ